MELDQTLAQYIRGNLLFSISRPLPHSAHYKETYIQQEHTSNFARDVYAFLSEKERMLAVFPWKALQHLTLAGTAMYGAPGLEITTDHGVESVDLTDLNHQISDLNEMVLDAIQHHGFSQGVIPPQCFDDDEGKLKSKVDDLRPKTRFVPQSSPRWKRKDVAASVEDYENNLSNTGQKKHDVETTTTTRVFNLPVWLKDDGEVPLLAKRSCPESIALHEQPEASQKP